ncbi:MAG: hypothetical protein ACLFQB_16000, partial [Chitinispirillaceae bacterium]
MILKNSPHRPPPTGTFSTGISPDEAVFIPASIFRAERGNPDAQKRKGQPEKTETFASQNIQSLPPENAQVIGFLDNPTPVYILDSDPSTAMARNKQNNSRNSGWPRSDSKAPENVFGIERKNQDSGRMPRRTASPVLLR